MPSGPCFNLFCPPCGEWTGGGKGGRRAFQEEGTACRQSGQSWRSRNCQKQVGAWKEREVLEMRVGIGWGSATECFTGACLVQLLSRVWFFVTPWTTAHQASLSITNPWSLLKLMSIELEMPSTNLILCRPLPLPLLQESSSMVNFMCQVGWATVPSFFARVVVAVKVWFFFFQLRYGGFTMLY